MDNLDPMLNVPNWNGSKVGLGGYWEWQANCERPCWAWYDDPQPLAVEQVSKPEPKTFWKATAVEFWMVVTTTFWAGVVMGMVVSAILNR